MSTQMEEVLQRLKRLETRVTRGFEGIGVDTYDSSDWLSLDEPSHTIYVSTLGRSIQVVNDAAKKLGAVAGKTYDVVWRGDTKATIQIY